VSGLQKKFQRIRIKKKKKEKFFFSLSIDGISDDPTVLTQRILGLA
jgi:hypothetical protein